MKLKEYIIELKKFAKNNPETLEMQVITSSDDEGNEFNPVYFLPTKGYYEKREFISHEQFEDYERDGRDTNAVCVN